ncbi:MAG: hypothetical protein WC523_03170 [Patescibacteria group bacterium]
MNKKNRLIIWAQVIFYILIILLFRIYYFKYQTASPEKSFINIFFDSLSRQQAKFFIWGIIAIALICLVFSTYRAFSKRKGAKYSKILETGLVGKEFSLLSDTEKKKTIHRVKKLVIFGVIFLVVAAFLLFYLL